MSCWKRTIRPLTRLPSAASSSRLPTSTISATSPPGGVGPLIPSAVIASGWGRIPGPPTISARSSPRIQWFTRTGSRRGAKPWRSSQPRAQRTAASAPGDPARRAPTPSVSSWRIAYDLPSSAASITRAASGDRAASGAAGPAARTASARTEIAGLTPAPACDRTPAPLAVLPGTGPRPGARGGRRVPHGDPAGAADREGVGVGAEGGSRSEPLQGRRTAHVDRLHERAVVADEVPDGRRADGHGLPHLDLQGNHGRVVAAGDRPEEQGGGREDERETDGSRGCQVGASSRARRTSAAEDDSIRGVERAPADSGEPLAPHADVHLGDGHGDAGQPHRLPGRGGDAPAAGHLHAGHRQAA